MLLTPTQLYTGETNSNGETDTFPIGLILGPGITAGNMIGAGTANTNFLNELEENYLYNKEIKAGETVYGIVGIYDFGYSPLTLE